MRRKKAIITFELVEESTQEKNEKIEQEMFDWIRESAISIPWVKDVKEITVKDE
jgi:hypothetical protein